MKSKRIAITNQDLMSMIHTASPEGVKYASDVMSLAVNLSDVAKTFYEGIVYNDYGMFPFLEMEEVHIENGNHHSKHVIIRSEFEPESFEDFVTGLFINPKDSTDILDNVRRFYHRGDGLLDTGYLQVMRFLIEYLKVLLRRNEEAEKDVEYNGSYLRLLFAIPIGLSHVVTSNEIAPGLLRRSARKYNRKEGKASGRFIRVINYPDVPKAVIVTCEKFIATPHK